MKEPNPLPYLIHIANVRGSNCQVYDKFADSSAAVTGTDEAVSGVSTFDGTTVPNIPLFIYRSDHDLAEINSPHQSCTAEEAYNGKNLDDPLFAEVSTGLFPATAALLNEDGVVDDQIVARELADGKCHEILCFFLRDQRTDLAIAFTGIDSAKPQSSAVLSAKSQSDTSGTQFAEPDINNAITAVVKEENW